MTKPTIVLVPGAWCPAEIYSDVIKSLEAHGYSATAISLPTVGAGPPQPTDADDAKKIRDCLTQLIEVEGKDVVLGLHSYAALPGSNAAQDFAKKKRLERGLKGGIVRFVLLASHPGHEGFCLFSGDVEPPPWMKIDMEQGIVTVGHEDAKNIFFHDLAPEMADEWARKLQHHSVAVFNGVMSYAPWKDIPSTYVRADGDRGHFSPPVVDAVLKEAREALPSAFDVEERTDAGHLFMVSRPEWVSQVFRRAAGEAV